ncbi:MAG: glycosyltransferase family 1 protein [Solirubrobacteraceae bacterium]
MHIGLNLLFLVPGETGGMEVAARETLPELVAAAPGTRFTAFVNREAAGEDWGAGIESVVLPVDARNRVEWVRGEQQLLPAAVTRAGCDLVHSLGSTAPLRGRFGRVVTIHDLIYKRFPEAHGAVKALGMRVLVPLAARSSHRIIAVSHATRDDLVELLHVPAHKVDVVAQAAAAPHVGPTPEPELRARLGLGKRRLLLTASAKRRHKNLVRLLEAHALLHRDRPLLVLPGYATEHEAELRAHATTLGTAADVCFLGWVGDADMEGLYAAAAAFVFPSLYEGFGLPVLEAMQRGVPVACSAGSALAEVAGDAALLFDPRDVAAIAGAVRTLLEDEVVAARLRLRGRVQAASFGWRATARGCLDVYGRVLGRPFS